MSKLNIINISDIKITKVRDWSIHFRYDNKLYMLHLSQDWCEESTTLFEVLEKDNNKLDAIHSEYDDNIPRLKLKNGNFRTKDSEPYNQIDLDKFVYDLTWSGYASSKFDDEIKLKKSPRYQKKMEIDRLQKEIEVLERLKEII